MTSSRDTLLVGVAVVALAIVAFAAGVWTGRGQDTTGDHEARLTALERRLGMGRPAAAGADAGRRAPEARAPGAPVEISLAGAPSLGPEDAPVTLVAFTDFQCPFCARSAPTLDRLRQAYGDRLRIVFKNYPLPIHPDAELAHRAALAAGEQGRFWELHDRIFANPRDLSRATLTGYARDLGLDMKAFEAALGSPEIAARIQADIDEGGRVGVRGTPTFFVNGRLFSGAQPYAAFQAQVERALAEAGGGGAAPTGG